MLNYEEINAETWEAEVRRRSLGALTPLYTGVGVFSTTAVLSGVAGMIDLLHGGAMAAPAACIAVVFGGLAGLCYGAVVTKRLRIAER